MGTAAVSITLRERQVLPPWTEAAAIPSRLLHAEDRLIPAAAPLARYLRVFPNRYVKWNRWKQLWEIRQRNHTTGKDERVAFVCSWEPAPGSGRLTAVFRAFDHQYVTERLRDWAMIQRHGLHHMSAVQTTKNTELARRRAAQADEEWTDIWRDIKRWLPAIAAEHRGERLDVARTYKETLVPGAILNPSNN